MKISRIAAFLLGALVSFSISGAPRFFVIDSGGTARLVKRLFVIDSGATARQAKRVFVIDSGGTARLVCCAMLSTTITTGDDGVSTAGYTSGLWGSIGTATYTDRGSNSRTIVIASWSGTNIQFWLSVASVPNTDTTFATITLAGPGGSVTLQRSAATYNGSASGGTRSSWSWVNSTYPGTTPQSVTLNVF